MNSNNKIVPLASIDEDEDDTNTIINNEHTQDKLNLYNNYEPRSSFSNQREESLNTNFLLSPISDVDPNISTTTQTDPEEFGDTGFFSSSSASSKRSSIDFDNSSSQFNSSKSSLNHRGGKIDNDEIFEMPINIEDGPSSSISTSLEDLVNSFDEKVKSCLRNFDENVTKLAPVQIRSQEEVIKNRPAWWTLTGNYGTILPIDWEKLSPDEIDGQKASVPFNIVDDNKEELVEDDVKLRELINSCLNSYTPIKTADEVLQEIDDIICGKLINNNGGEFNSQCSSLCSRSSSVSLDYIPVILRSTFYRFSLDKLKTFSLDQLQDLYEDLESKTAKHSQELVNRLAERDEMEFEKEIKNVFLSLLIKIQKRRKEYYRNYGNKEQEITKHHRRRYLTTLIPYCKNSTLNNIESLQALIKIMKAMLDDSPAVPTLLTDYILKFICPFNASSMMNNNMMTTIGQYLRANEPTRPKSSPLQTSGNNFNLTLNQTINNTFHAAKRSFSFRNTLFGTVPTTEVPLHSTTNNNNNEKKNVQNFINNNESEHLRQNVFIELPQRNFFNSNISILMA